MEKHIITISREFGSGGRTIGKLVAEHLFSAILLIGSQFFRNSIEKPH